MSTYSPKTAWVSLSSWDIGVPVKAINVALGSPSLKARARPYLICPVFWSTTPLNPYWVLCASSTKTIIGNRQIYTASMGEGKTAVEKQKKSKAVEEIKKLSEQILLELK